MSRCFTNFLHIHLIVLILFIKICISQLDIKGCGTGFVSEGDIALIFYITVMNICPKDLQISVSALQCLELTGGRTDPNNPTEKSMSVIGGDMGILRSGEEKNLTLIYPNLFQYLLNREGVCTFEIKYHSDEASKSILKDVKFSTNKTDEAAQCGTLDLEPLNNCMPVDCVIKYTGQKSFFNPVCNECEAVPACVCDPLKSMPEMAYSLAANNCTNLNDSIIKNDLELLETNEVDTSEEDRIFWFNIVCHHGEMDSTGQCICHEGWRTTVGEDDEEEEFQPSLFQYHMCNIETSGWNEAYKGKIKMTALIIGILAVTITSKLIIAMCILNWCYKHFKRKDEKPCIDRMDSYEESFLLCENIESPRKCICKDLPEKRSPMLHNQTVNVAYYPCIPSTASSGRMSEEWGNEKRSKSDRSIILSKTTSSSMAISFETESEDTIEDTDDTDEEEDSEIEFSEEGNEDNVKCECEPIDERGESDNSGQPVHEARSSKSRQSSGKGSQKKSHGSVQDSPEPGQQ